VIASATLRRFEAPAHRSAMSLLPDGHPALAAARTRYPEMVVWPGFGAPLLKRGHHNRKIGDRVLKGRLAGAPIYTLTLEERATCWSGCRHWRDCYGNKMHFAARLMHGPALEWRLGAELADLARQHPDGFLVRLHVLGDFYSLAYVRRWLSWLRRLPALNVFGYTSWPAGSPIGALLADAACRLWPRFAIRLSNQGASARGVTTVYGEPKGPVVPEGIVCPAETGRTDCCATCALCWSTPRNIAFLAH
jgi:hypothetical protein